MSSIEPLLNWITSKLQTITLAFDDPRIKPAVCLGLVERLTSRVNVVYVDFDLQLSSQLQNLDLIHYDRINCGGRLMVLQPNDEILDFVESISFQNMQQGGLLVLDSLNTLQSLLTDDTSSRGSKIANQKTALLVTVLQKLSRFYSKSLIIVNVTKSRPSDRNMLTSTFWEKTLVGGRMIKFKSDAILSVSQNQSHEVELKFQNTGHGMSSNLYEERYLLNVDSL